jgi:copper chaperone NosL
MARREALAVLASLASSAQVACSREGSRCAYCGMKVDPASPWRADLIRADGSHVGFDTPRCALLAWRTGRVPAVAISVQEFYDRAWRNGQELRFALGSDVMGPMGAELVPVDPSRAQKFASDHHATRVVVLDDLTAALLAPP